MTRLALACALCGVAVTVAFAEPPAFKRAGGEPLEFRGAGRELPEPEVEDVALAWFGPGDPEHPEYGEFWRGALVALEVENAAGGYSGRPFRLVPVWSENPWTAGVAALARAVYEQQAWAILGGIDGASTHLAEQVALKARLAVVSPASTDATAHMANVPWLHSLPPPDTAHVSRIAGLLADAGGAFAVVAAAEHDAHAALVELRKALAERGLVPASLLEFATESADLDPLAAQLVERAPSAIVVLAPARAAGRLVAEIRDRGFEGRVLGGATLARQAFRRAAGRAAEGVIVPRAERPAREWNDFAARYAARWSAPPDDAAARGHDAVRLVAAAVRCAGLNRARIGDALRELGPWSGAAGAVRWDALGRNPAAEALGRWAGDGVVALEDLEPLR